MPKGGRSPHRPLAPSGTGINRLFQTQRASASHFGSARPFAFSFAQIRQLRGGRTLARASHRAIARQARTHPHSKRRHQWRRHILQGQAAVPANFHGRAFHAQPVSSSGASRIQTLHGTAGQMLHRVSNKFGWGNRTIENRTHFARGTLVCQEETSTISWGALPATRSPDLGIRVERPRLLPFALITYVKLRNH
jgi:hypothetical protein